MSKADDFDDWLIAMDDKLEQLESDLPESVASMLDFTPASLSILEAWILENFTSTDEMLARDRYLLDRLSCYVGETIRKTAGGVWAIDYSNKDDVYYGLPVIRAKGTVAECPLTVVTAALDRRLGTYKESVLRGMINLSRKEKD